MLIADLHIHSKYSRATSRDCTPEHLDLWARKKGIDLLGTGDFTHPAWRAELREKLKPAEEGLYVLRESMRLQAPSAPDRTPRFVVSGEISSIYKKNGRVRKVHNVILLPGLEAADVLCAKLEAIGNIHSDGRPILGLDSRDLLEITLEACPAAVFIPAHIWTPHFSLFGAFSGFDTIEECFGDLTGHIHAVETGLSSDPPMNHRLSALDSYTLISNSDAHSPAKLGREANLLEIEYAYSALAAALRDGEKAGFRGTVEFFPEEGKYHFDGHRNCGICLSPAQTMQTDGKCPVCGKKITIGVQHRVEELADRPEGYIRKGAPGFESLAPLPEVIGASMGRSAGSVKVRAQYEALLQALGSEFYILRQASLEEIKQAAGSCVAEGLRRLRAGEVVRQPGFDGEYGTIQLFSPMEIEMFNGQISLFGAGEQLVRKTAPKREPGIREPVKSQLPPKEKPPEQLNPAQREAVTVQSRAIAVIAGPGTGKTKTLVARIAHLVKERGVKPSEITAVTFTNQAAGELRRRLEKELGGKRAARRITIGTFHAICLDLLAKVDAHVTLADDFDRRELAQGVLKHMGEKGSSTKLLRAVSRVKSGIPVESAGISEQLYNAYCAALHEQGLMDFDDLLLQGCGRWAEISRQDKAAAKRFTYLLVDEVQDINPVQYQLLLAWGEQGKELFAIGDPDQSIYGFRGADPCCFDRLAADFPALNCIRLEENYRSTPEILACALPVISHNTGEARRLMAQQVSGKRARLLTAETPFAEAVYIAKEINAMVGGIGMLEAHRAVHDDNTALRSFSDIAVLYRTHRQAQVLEKCLQKEGVPYTVAGRDNFLAAPDVHGALCFFRFLLEPKNPIYLKSCLHAVFGVSKAQAGNYNVQDLAEEAPNDTQARADSPIALLKQAMDAFLPVLQQEPPGVLIKQYFQSGEKALSESAEKLLRMAEMHQDMYSFLQTAVLGQEGDVRRGAGKRYDAGTVSLMTLHGAKGLEFPVVFLCGLNRGCLPLETGGDHLPSDVEEERRLFYVGMTRAKEALVLLTSEEPSSFLAELPDEVVERGEAVWRKKRSDGRQLSLFG